MKKIISCLLLLFSGLSWAVDLELTQGINSALPITINSFGENTTASEVSETIDSDLRMSGQFKLLPFPTALRGNMTLAGKQVGADSVLTGQVNAIGSNRYEVSFELIDPAAQGRVLLTHSFQVPARDMRNLAHHISDMVYEKLTGERGIFSTRIAYILVQRGAGRTRYSLEVADADGRNPQSLLVSSEPIMSPTWSPDGQQLAYVSFEKKKPQIYTVNVSNGQRRLITDFSGINGAPTWSPDGRQLAVVLSKSGSPKIYTINLSNGAMKQLTFGDAIDTEPRYSPDGKSLLFTSGRGGSPQVYKMSLSDGMISRITYDGNYNARASYTPDLRHIVMLHREDSKFNIAVQDSDTNQINQLTFAPLDESPSVAPNGRLILYATRYNDQGVLSIVSIDGRIRQRFPSRDGDIQEPSWSPFLG